MRLAKKLADRIVFLHEARALFVARCRRWCTARMKPYSSSCDLDELVVPGRDDGYAIYT